MKKLLVLFIIALLGFTVAAQPEPPHRVYGDITDTVASEDNLTVEFVYSGSFSPD